MVAINPRFAPAYVELAKLDLGRGDGGAALKMAQKAEGLEPFRSGYRVMTVEILLRTGHPAGASARAAYVANRWGGPDHDEAMELWNSIPAAKRVSESLVDKPRPNPTRNIHHHDHSDCRFNHSGIAVDPQRAVKGLRPDAQRFAAYAKIELTPYSEIF